MRTAIVKSDNLVGLVRQDQWVPEGPRLLLTPTLACCSSTLEGNKDFSSEADFHVFFVLGQQAGIIN